METTFQNGILNQRESNKLCKLSSEEIVYEKKVKTWNKKIHMQKKTAKTSSNIQIRKLNVKKM